MVYNYWLRPPTGLCAGGKQTVGYMQGVVNRLSPHHHDPPQIDHFCITVGCWLRSRGLGPKVALRIGIAATCIANKGRVVLPHTTWLATGEK